MDKHNTIQMLDCTLRDGAYITGGYFGTAAIKGIIEKTQEAGAQLIECGWLKDAAHETGYSYYHVPADLEQYLGRPKEGVTYLAMIDWDRYQVENLPPCDGKSIHAIRVVFPFGRQKEAIEIGRKIRDKGYLVYFQAANTLAYDDESLRLLAADMNAFRPEGLSVVDTFGAMYFNDLERIAGILDRELLPDIRIGFHAHNNQQLAFALVIRFAELMAESGRDCIVDATLCGMGRGAGNATTELVAGYLNRQQSGGYDLDAIMDAIDIYMQEFQEKYSWGYSTPYFIAGLYQCHVNNIAYLQSNHRTNARDMRHIIASLSTEERRKYDYDLLEQKYLENQDRKVDDDATAQELRKDLSHRKVVLICPGRSSLAQKDVIDAYIQKENAVVIGVNAILPGYAYDHIFFVNHARYDYARQAHPETFHKTPKIILSNIKTTAEDGEVIVGYHRAIKRGWEHFDNAAICCLRLMEKLGVKDIAIAGFDGFKHQYNESYADPSLPTLNPAGKWDELNEEIREIYQDFKNTQGRRMEITFLTESYFA
ncbi:MAG: hypothetical protein IK078_01610 [Lachnospiraceae bacterium]|nr:hypothetical protein [Lachnospiraceae bacterium]